jgi:hypothetical protein
MSNINIKQNLNQKQTDPLLRLKPEISYSNDVLKNIKLLSISKDNLAKAFGSFVYSFQKYAGDIDLFEVDQSDLSHDGLMKAAAKRIQEIVKTINDSKTMFFSEMKAGLDSTYFFDVGNLENGIYDSNSFLYFKANNLWENHLLTNKEFLQIEIGDQLIEDKKVKSINESTNIYDMIYGIFRERRTLRWSADEILKGFKLLPDGNKYTLHRAMAEKAMIKYDMISYVDGKFVEVTNLVFLVYKDEDGDFQPLNISEEDLHNPESLKEETEKLFYSNKFFNPMKGCKRLYAIMRVLNRFDYLEQVTRIVGGNISLLYQQKGALEAIEIIIERGHSFPKEKINRNLDLIKSRIVNVIELSNDVINNLCEKINIAILQNSKQIKLDIIKDIIHNFKKIISDHTIRLMTKEGLFPIPNMFMPLEYSFDYPNTMSKVDYKIEGSTKYDRKKQFEVGIYPFDEYKLFVKHIDQLGQLEIDKSNVFKNHI